MASPIERKDSELQAVSTEAPAAGNTDRTGVNTETPKNIPAAKSPSNLKASKPVYLHIIKWTALIIIALFVCVGAVLSKVTLVSITGKMFALISSRDGHMDTVPAQSVLFIQLTLILIIPEVVSFFRCLIWGVIGKTTEQFPWPNRSAFVGGVIASIIEVFTICGFIYGAACKLPPLLTILIMNGCFCFPIGCYFIHQLQGINIRGAKERKHNKEGYVLFGSDSAATEDLPLKGYLKHTVTTLEILGFIMQLGALVSIPVLLSTEHFYLPSGKASHYITATYILIPLSLCAISVLWSGWIQKLIIRSSGNNKNAKQPSSNETIEFERTSDDDETARLKTGLINSAIKVVLIPFVSYGYAVLLLDLKVDLHASSFDWNNLELSTFLTHVIVSYFTYLFAWIACALQSWAFVVPMLLSTPLSFVWYIISVEVDEVFPFTDEYTVEWNLHYIILIVASVLWLSQFLAFGYHIFQNSDKVLAKDGDLFWMPRYNSVFLEQQMILNRKTAISGSVVMESNNMNAHGKAISKDNVIFICSTMYHENEKEMKQLLMSIREIAKARIQNKRNNKYESHIFFDDACTSGQLNRWALQLLGLLKETLGIEDDKINELKIITPYGMQLHYTMEGEMPFYIHLKDNSKVKNKKRWSQVMYMNYILKYRIEKRKMVSEDKAFILTTDADIDFTSGSVIALLDILARDKGVGAVCARTHPLGSGPVVWYQKFDYAIGHWFQKAAEHTLGCVLCCPGCFSVFRVKALGEVLKTYSSNVEDGFDFLTKDMGEDRWLCTLLIQKGWRLEYSAVSQDYTFCPETFEEFYKQRRRWIPSTIANLTVVIGQCSEITRNNSITLLFILYQFIIVFSSLISPATVILIIVSGLKALDHSVNEPALIIVLSIISVLYGAICMYATEKTQLDTAKFLTLVFSIIMALVLSGILSGTIYGLIEGQEMEHAIGANDTSHHFQLPVDISAIYSGIFAVTFIIAGILHFDEFFCLLHFIWYILCLPSGYLFLIIYSVCNLNNRSWGTREEKEQKRSRKSGTWLEYFLGKWSAFRSILCICIGKTETTQPLDLSLSEDSDNVDTDIPLIPDSKLSDNVQKWLKKHNCEKYADNFKREGYTKKYFIATMKMEDFEAIGINERGFQLKLEKEVKKLCSIKIKVKVPKTVSKWLRRLKMEEYEELFRSKGYFSSEDVENLKGLKENDLRVMGIKKRAHLKQLMMGLNCLQYPTTIDKRINDTRSLMKKGETKELKDTGSDENSFWVKLVKDKLQPESANLGKTDELQKKLKDLRNLSVLIIFLINVMWIAFLYTLVFPQLTKYNLPDKAFSLLFLFIFSFIVLVQFFAMLAHRFKSLLHLLAGIRPKNNRWDTNGDVEKVDIKVEDDEETDDDDVETEDDESD